METLDQRIKKLDGLQSLLLSEVELMETLRTLLVGCLYFLPITSLLLSEVELMETSNIFFIRVIWFIIASFIGSGINGNL